jgi:hypothetical protein
MRDLRRVYRLSALDDNLCDARGERVGSDTRNWLLGDDTRRFGNDRCFGNTRRFDDAR